MASLECSKLPNYGKEIKEVPSPYPLRKMGILERSNIPKTPTRRGQILFCRRNEK